MVKLRSIIVTGEDVKVGAMGYVPHVFDTFVTSGTFTGSDDYYINPPKPRVTTCKNCGAPVHNNVCEYCGTEY